MAKNYYRILGVSPDADEEEIRRAYKRLALATHPDCGCSTPEKFLEIQEAYENLRDAATRKRHDQQLHRRAAQRASAQRPGPRRDEPARTLHVHLDPAEAREGCRLAVPISLPHPCPACGGWGLAQTEVCAQCLGHGRLISARDIALTIPAGVRHGTRVRLALDLEGVGSLELEVLVTIADGR